MKLQPKKLTGIICLLLLGTPLWAEPAADNAAVGEAAVTDDSTQLPDITVNGYGFNNSVYRTSGSIQVITAEDIKKANLKTLDDLKARVPGVTFLNNVAAGDSFLFIRGVGDFVDEYGKGTQVIVDGMPLANVDSRNILLQDEVERIEVLKGPQNILFGPYAKGGAINVITKRPTKTGGWLKLGFGNDGQRTYGLAYDYVINPALTLGFMAQREEDDGWLKNVYDHKDYGGRKYTDYVFKVNYTPAEDLTVRLKVFRNERRVRGPIMVTYDFDQGAPLDYNFFNLVKGRTLDFWEFASDFSPLTRTKEKGGVLEFIYNISNNVTFRSTTTYMTQSRYRRTDTDASAVITPITLIDTIDDVSYHNYSQDFRFSGDFDKWKWIAGYSLQRTRNEMVRLNLIGLDAGFLGYNRSNGFYTQISWLPIEQLEFTAGGRYQTDSITFEADGYERHKYLGPLFKEVLLPMYKQSSGIQDANKRRDSTFLYSATATWKITPKAHLYFNRAKTYKPLGIAAGIVPGSFDKEIGHTKELGFKGLFFNDRVFLTTAGFEMKFDDMQAFNPLTNAITNVAKVNYKGYEVDLRYRIIPNLTVGANYTKISSKIKAFKGNDAIVGKKFPYFPHYTGAFNVTYTQPTKIGEITAYADYATYGNLYADYDNLLKAKPVKTVNASLALNYKQHEVKLWANNLLNKKFYTSQYSISGISGAAYGRGRAFGVDYKFKF